MEKYSKTVTGESKDIHKRVAEMLSKTYKNTALGAGHYAGAIKIGDKHLFSTPTKRYLVRAR